MIIIEEDKLKHIIYGVLIYYLKSILNLDEKTTKDYINMLCDSIFRQINKEINPWNLN